MGPQDPKALDGWVALCAVVWVAAWVVVWVAVWAVAWGKEWVESSLVAPAEPWQVVLWCNPCPWCCSRNPAGLGTMLLSPTSGIRHHSRRGVCLQLLTATKPAMEAAATSSNNSSP